MEYVRHWNLPLFFSEKSFAGGGGKNGLLELV